MAITAVLVAGSLLVLPVPATEAHTCTPDASIGVAGRLLVPRASGVAEITLPDRAVRTIPISPAQGAAMAVAISADGAMLAVPRFWRPPADRVGGQDILLVGPDGGEPLGTVARSGPGEAVGAPTWLADGSLVYERRQLNDPPEAVRIERVRPGQTDQPAQLIAQGGAMPSASPDGTRLVMVRSGTGERLVTMNADGSQERVLVDRPELLTIAFPRFSPDGSQIAFAAATDPSSLPETKPTPGSRPAASVPAQLQPALPLPLFGQQSGALGAFGASAVSAHGVPWDVWLVRPDASGLQRLTIFQDDDSSLAWSPDGRHIATLSAEAIHVVSLDGAESYCISAEGGYGGMEWLP